MIVHGEYKNSEPCVWERGGRHRRIGRAWVIGGVNAEALKPLRVRKKGHLANKKHALIPVKIGSFLAYASKRGKNISLTLFRVSKITQKNEKKCILELEKKKYLDTSRLLFSINDLSDSQKTLLYNQKMLLDAAYRKAKMHHCRKPCYII